MANNSLINREMAPTMANIFRYLPVITLTGPRQSGKTTLCRKVFASLPYANLEDASTLAEARSRWQDASVRSLMPRHYP